MARLCDNCDEDFLKGANSFIQTKEAEKIDKENPLHRWCRLLEYYLREGFLLGKARYLATTDVVRGDYKSSN